MEPFELMRSIRAGREIVDAHEVFAGLAENVLEATFINVNGKEQRIRDVTDVKIWLQQLAIATKFTKKVQCTIPS